MSINIGTIYINPYDIYCIQIVDKLSAIIALEKILLNLDDSKQEKKNRIKKAINEKLEFIKYLFKNEDTYEFINLELPLDGSGKLLNYNNININKYVNPLVVFVDNFKSNWIKFKIIYYWVKYGGNYENIFDSSYLIKKDLIYLIEELSKDLLFIDKNIIKEYSKKLYDLLDDELKKKLNTFNVYLVIRNNVDKKNPNKIYKIDKNDFDKLDKYYRLGINNELLKKDELGRIYNAYQVYLESLESSELSPAVIFEYEKFLNLQNEESLEIQKKLTDMKTKYYSFELDKNLKDPAYKRYRENILLYYNFLKSINYNFKKEQADKIKTLNVKMMLEGNIPIQFGADNFFPLFYYDDLCKLKTDLLENKDKLCGYIKNIFPMYSISHDLFCVVEKNNQRKYINRETIDKTINFYCVVIFIVGIINHQLKKYNQDYMIIIKGGKALQIILSEMNFKDDNILKSNDIDLIIAPIEGKKYIMNKCKFLAINICLLIQWILNTTKNMYTQGYYVSYKLPFETDEYKFVIKLSHKIQNSNDDFDPKFTPVADFDFNQIEKKIFYSDLVNTTKDTPIGKLTFTHQNLDNFLLEKIYYIGFNIDLAEKNNLIQDTKINNYKYISIVKEKINENYNQIEKFKEEIEKFNINISEHKKKINENKIKLEAYHKKLYSLNTMIDGFKNHKNETYYQQLLRKYIETNDNYQILFNENEKILNQLEKLEYYKDDYNKKIKQLDDENVKYSIEIQNKKEENEKIIPNTIKKAQRFINKFSYQVKSAAKIITKNYPSDSKDTSLSKQKEYINKLILDNQQKLEFDDLKVFKIISTIFS